jgi:hypothetical protein
MIKRSIYQDIIEITNARYIKQKVESNLNLGTHNQTFKQLRQLNDRNHYIPISTNT